MAKIPDAALEAGMNTFLAGEENVMTSFEQDITAAFLAMLEAWPGMDVERFMPDSGPYTIHLPMLSEDDPCSFS
jgi:hypothetical protein